MKRCGFVTPSEKRRRELLEQTRELYSERRVFPAIHPRYTGLYGELYQENEGHTGTLGIRVVLCLMLFMVYIAMDYTGATTLDVSSSQIASAVVQDFRIEDTFKMIDLDQ